MESAQGLKTIRVGIEKNNSYNFSNYGHYFLNFGQNFSSVCEKSSNFAAAKAP
jgi:hypothetical protein